MSSTLFFTALLPPLFLAPTAPWHGPMAPHTQSLLSEPMIYFCRPLRPPPHRIFREITAGRLLVIAFAQNDSTPVPDLCSCGRSSIEDHCKTMSDDGYSTFFLASITARGAARTRRDVAIREGEAGDREQVRAAALLERTDGMHPVENAEALDDRASRARALIHKRPPASACTFVQNL